MTKMKRRWINWITKNLLVVLAASIFLVSCSKDDEAIAPGLTAYNESVVDYFKEVALGFEFLENHLFVPSRACRLK